MTELTSRDKDLRDVITRIFCHDQTYRFHREITAESFPGITITQLRSSTSSQKACCFRTGKRTIACFLYFSIALCVWLIVQFYLIYDFAALPPQKQTTSPRGLMAVPLACTFASRSLSNTMAKLSDCPSAPHLPGVLCPPRHFACLPAFELSCHRARARARGRACATTRSNKYSRCAGLNRCHPLRLISFRPPSSCPYFSEASASPFKRASATQQSTPSWLLRTM